MPDRRGRPPVPPYRPCGAASREAPPSAVENEFAPFIVYSEEVLGSLSRLSRYNFCSYASTLHYPKSFLFVLLAKASRRPTLVFAKLKRQGDKTVPSRI